MSIKTRLLLSYIAMLVIPVLLTIMVTLGIAKYQVNKLENLYGISLQDNAFHSIIKQKEQLEEELLSTAASNPEKLADISFLSRLDKHLEQLHAGVVIRKDSKIIYTSPILHKLDIGQYLSAFGSTTDRDAKKRNSKLIGETLIVMKQVDFYFANQTPGSLFLITDNTYLHHTITIFLASVIGSGLLILILTNGLLTYSMSRSIVKPLEHLKKAAFQIKEGNLDHQIKPLRKDEIGALCAAFEEMRVKLKESEERQQQYENNRKQLITNISHDLKTPITAIKGYVEGIMDGVADTPEKHQKYMKTIYTKAGELDRLIDELFLFSKLDLSKLPFDIEQADIVSYLNDFVEEYKLELMPKNISITLEVSDAGPVMVLADREKLRRVIANIVSNAVKYMDKDPGMIKVAMSIQTTEVTVEIRDNGQGIASQALPHVFDRFYRADPARNSSTGGSGLGLAIAKLIIEEQGGRIWTRSQEGVGTSIFFTLVRVAAGERRANNEAHPDHRR